MDALVNRANQLLLSYPEAMQVLGGIGRTKFFEILPELTKISIGRRAFVTAASVTAYVDHLADQAQTA